MIVKLLGVVDLLIALVLFLMALQVSVPFVLLLMVLVALAVKSLPFVLNFCIASLIDLCAGLIILVNMLFGMPAVILLIAAFAIGQKGVFSLL